MSRPGSAFIADREEELCRICFSRKPTFLNVFETPISSKMTIADMFVQFLGENMYPDDNLPEFICCDCIEEVMETGNINKDYKDAVRHVVWRTRLLETECFGNRKSVIGRSATLDIEKIFSEDNKVTEKKVMDEIKWNATALPTAFATKSSSILQDEMVENGTITKIKPENPVESNIHECSICKGVFLNEEDLIEHKKLFHNVNNGFHCGKCHKRFKTEKRLERHVEKYSFSCKSKGGEIFKGHVQKFIGFPSTTVSVATKNQDIREEKTEGFSKEDSKYCCDICESYFETKEALKTHLRETHSSTSPFICGLCNKGLISRLHLESHKRSHVKEYSCDFCKMEFFDLKRYESHLKRCQANEVQKCQICGKEVTTKWNLKLHLRTHSLVKKFECEICQKKYHRSTHLYDHMRAIHLKQKPHECGVCQKSFSSRLHLLRHLACHSDKRPFSCCICDKRFKRHSIRSRHEKTVHNHIKPQKVSIIVDERVLEKIQRSN